LFKKTPPTNIGQGLIGNVDSGNFGPLEKLAEHCEISIENLKNIFDYDGKKFILITKIEGGTEAEKQVRGALLILTAWYKGLGEEWVTSIKLGEALSTRSIATNHIVESLKAKNNLFKDNGKARRSMAYGLKTQGWQEGIRLIKELAGT